MLQESGLSIETALQELHEANQGVKLYLQGFLEGSYLVVQETFYMFLRLLADRTPANTQIRVYVGPSQVIVTSTLDNRPVAQRGAGPLSLLIFRPGKPNHVVRPLILGALEETPGYAPNGTAWKKEGIDACLEAWGHLFKKLC